MLVIALSSAGFVAITPPHSANAAIADPWPTFHHDSSHSGVSSDTAISASNAGGLAQQWAQYVGTSILSSPAVVYNAILAEAVVYFGDSAGVVHAGTPSGNGRRDLYTQHADSETRWERCQHSRGIVQLQIRSL